MIIELKDRKITCTPEEYREMLLKGLIGDGPIWTGNAVDKAPEPPGPEDYLTECLMNRRAQRTPISLTETLRDRHRDEEILRCLDLMPHSRPHSKMAEDFERDLFVTMRVWGVSKVYVVQETTTDKNGIARWDLWFQRDRPEGKPCTEHDFQNLLDMSDAEFSRLPYSPNKYVVEEWRKELQTIRSTKKPFPTAPCKSATSLVPDEENI